MHAQECIVVSLIRTRKENKKRKETKIRTGYPEKWHISVDVCVERVRRPIGREIFVKYRPGGIHTIQHNCRNGGAVGSYKLNAIPRSYFGLGIGF